MIECLPQSLCSWNFRARGEASGDATIEFNWFTEQGVIHHHGTRYEIRKHGPMSGRWTLERAGNTFAEAVKPSAMFRSFRIAGTDAVFELAAAGPLSRAFELRGPHQILGTIRPAHAFTRRAIIHCHPSIPPLLQLFAFWLAALTWRRSSRNSNS